MRFFRILLSTLILVGGCLGSESSFQWTTQLEEALRKITEHASGMGNDSERIIKAEWDRQFPMFSYLDSDYLWQHAQALSWINEVNYERRKKTFFKWEPKLKSELVEIYHTTNSGARNHSKRIHDEWVKRHEKLANMRPLYLLRKVRTFMDESQSNKTKKSKVAYGWTKELNCELLKAANENPKKYKELHQEWTAKHTEFRNITVEQLRVRVRYLKRQHNVTDSSQGMQRDESGRTKEHDKDRLGNYFEHGSLSQNVHEKQVEMYPDFQEATPDLLLQREWHLTRQGNVTDGKKIKKPGRKSDWTKKHDENLVKIYLENDGQSQKVHEEWVKMYPDFKRVTPGLLMQRAWRLTRHKNMTDASRVRKYFKWEDEHNADLYHIYRRTDTGERNHWDRIWDCWKEMHPDLTDIKLSKLQVKQKHFSKVEYKPSAEDEEKARKRFDDLSMAHLYKYDSTGVFPKRSGRKGKRVLSPSRGSPLTSQQHPNVHDQYRDMTMFSPLPHEHFYEDPYQYMNLSSLGHTPHEDLNPQFHKQDEHHD